jgi:hypothetical protein
MQKQLHIDENPLLPCTEYELLVSQLHCRSVYSNDLLEMNGKCDIVQGTDSRLTADCGCCPKRDW